MCIRDSQNSRDAYHEVRLAGLRTAGLADLAGDGSTMNACWPCFTRPYRSRAIRAMVAGLCNAELSPASLESSPFNTAIVRSWTAMACF